MVSFTFRFTLKQNLGLSRLALWCLPGLRSQEAWPVTSAFPCQEAMRPRAGKRLVCKVHECPPATAGPVPALAFPIRVLQPFVLVTPVLWTLSHLKQFPLYLLLHFYLTLVCISTLKMILLLKMMGAKFSFPLHVVTSDQWPNFSSRGLFSHIFPELMWWVMSFCSPAPPFLWDCYYMELEEVHAFLFSS